MAAFCAFSRTDKLPLSSLALLEYACVISTGAMHSLKKTNIGFFWEQTSLLLAAAVLTLCYRQFLVTKEVREKTFRLTLHSTKMTMRASR